MSSSQVVKISKERERDRVDKPFLPDSGSFASHLSLYIFALTDSLGYTLFLPLQNKPKY